MNTIRKTFKFEMAHQLMAAATQCCVDTIHGHSYIAEVFLQEEELDSRGMVVDFGALGRFKSFFDGLDHALVMPDSMDEQYLEMLKRFNKKLILVPFNPTAENLAYMTYNALNVLPGGHCISKVRIHETATGWAEYSPCACEFSYPRGRK